MLLVPTEIALSPLHGIGLFATAPIAQGTVVQRYWSTIDCELSVFAVAQMPEPANRFVLRYAYRTMAGYILCGDDARFLNHSNTPNLTGGEGYQVDVAARDIRSGEELTVDYYAFDLDADYKLNQRRT
jgi:SET domain-containing protein